MFALYFALQFSWEVWTEDYRFNNSIQTESQFYENIKNYVLWGQNTETLTFESNFLSFWRKMLGAKFQLNNEDFYNDGRENTQFQIWKKHERHCSVNFRYKLIET